MKIGILGTGVVGKTLAQKLASLGHDVMVGTRDPEETRSRSTPGAFGDPAFGPWLAANPTVKLGRFDEAAAHGEMILNAASGAQTLAVIAAAGPHLDGKILVDIANPLDFSRGMPPSLTVCNDDSLGEQVQRAAPRARVVKTLNTVNAWIMVDPGQLAGGDHSLFVCGDDPAAKASVRAWLAESFGWKDVVDLGGISASRGTEMYLPLWVRMYGALQTPNFSIKVVR